jgi:MFS family permease
LYRDPLALGFIGLSLAIPFIGAALWAGHLVDQHEKRKFMIMSEAGHVMTSLGLFALTFLDKPPLIPIYLLLGWQGFCSSFENIAATAYAQSTISKEDFPRAAGWNLALFQAAIIIGPIFGGWMLAHSNARVVYAFIAIVLCISCLLATTLQKAEPHAIETEEEPAWQRVKMGLKFIRSERLILGSMALDMVAVLFGDCVGLFPIFAERLGVGPMGLGILRASPPIGSLCVSLLQSMRPFVVVGWKTLKIVVAVFGVAMICFAFSHTMWISMLCLIVSGAADGISVIVRQSIYQSMTPAHLRGRVSSVSLIFISSSNEIGDFESGFTAKLMGVVPAVLFGGVMTLVSVLGMGWWFRDLNQRR